MSVAQNWIHETRECLYIFKQSTLGNIRPPSATPALSTILYPSELSILYSDFTNFYECFHNLYFLHHLKCLIILFYLMFDRFC